MSESSNVRTPGCLPGRLLQDLPKMHDPRQFLAGYVGEDGADPPHYWNLEEPGHGSGKYKVRRGVRTWLEGSVEEIMFQSVQGCSMETLLPRQTIMSSEPVQGDVPSVPRLEPQKIDEPGHEQCYVSLKIHLQR